MGWIGYPNAPRDPAAEITRLCTFETDERRSAPIMLRQIGATFYAAVRSEPRGDTAAPPRDFETDETGAYVFGAVFLTRRSRGEWLYKSMDETMGPWESGAPAALIDALSPTTNASAQDWRRRCRAHATLARRAVSHGDVIRFAAPLHFPTGTRQTFRVVRERRPGARRDVTRFECVESGVMCRIAGFTGMAWEIIERAGEGAT